MCSSDLENESCSKKTKDINDMKNKLENVKLERGRKLAQALRMESFIENLKKGPESLDSWSEEIWNLMLEKGVVNRDKTITFIFKNGKEIRM